jgi:hypothetical protein
LLPIPIPTDLRTNQEPGKEPFDLQKALIGVITYQLEELFWRVHRSVGIGIESNRCGLLGDYSLALSGII